MAGTNPHPTVFGTKMQSPHPHRTQTLGLEQDDVIRERWKILERIGAGGFGEIFVAYDNEEKQNVAIKTEANDEHNNLRMEINVIRKLQGKSHAARFIGCGKTEKCKFVVMQLLSRNLSELRRQQPTEKFSQSTAFRICFQALQAIREVHSIGFLHRDIKPSNFAMGSTEDTEKTLYILDFGLARDYIVEGKMRQARPSCGFRGTTRYAALTTHESKELGRADDVQSLFYAMIEMVKGKLPWRTLKDKDEIKKMKMETTVESLSESLPPQILEFGLDLQRTPWLEAPDYDLLAGYLRAAAGKAVRKSWKEEFDWEPH